MILEFLIEKSLHKRSTYKKKKKRKKEDKNQEKMKKKKKKKKKKTKTEEVSVETGKILNKKTVRLSKSDERFGFEKKKFSKSKNGLNC